MSAGSKRAYDELSPNGASSGVEARRVHPRTADGTLAAADAAAQTAPPAVMRLHRHALESVFSFLDQSDLHRVLSVSVDWQAAVLSMRPIESSAYVTVTKLPQLLNSRLRRHIQYLEIDDQYSEGRWTALGAECLNLLAERLQQLRGLVCVLQLPFPGGSVCFPAGLVSVSLAFTALSGDGEDAPLLDPSQSAQLMALYSAVLAAVLSLPHLSSLTFWGLASDMSLESLQRMPSLRTLELGWGRGQTMSPVQATQLRAVRQLEQLTLPQLDESPD